MSLNAATIELLLSKGLSGSDLLDVARSLEAGGKPDTAADRRRAYDRERKRAKRQVEREAEGLSGGNPVESPTDNPVDGARVSPNEIYSNPLPLTQVISNEITPPSDFELELDEGPTAKPRPEHALEAWNEIAERNGLATAQKLTPKRRRAIQSLLKEHGVEGFVAAFGAVDQSKFLRGENQRGWRADLDWVLKPDNFVKVMEGTFV